ncbi:MAG: 23S rRNA (adenine(2503)-C(2))-methyltransferase RlmN [Chloroflexota bacterium]
MTISAPISAPVGRPAPIDGASLPPITDLSLAELRFLVTELGQPAFRAEQISGWVYRSTIASFEEMSNLPKTLRTALAERYRFVALDQRSALLSVDGETRKVALALADGETVESVLMRYPQRSDGTGSERATLCVSTQVGCPVKCAFCATGLMGFARNLSSGEILDQALHFLRWTRQNPPIVRNVVFMGMGEPLLNYENTMAAIDRLVDPKCAGMGVHRMTVSTSGWIPGITRLTEDPLAVRLAVSLHAANDDLRTCLVPLNKRFPIADLMDALHEYQSKTGRRVTFEYTMLDGVNDAPNLAHQLVSLLRGLDSHVNLMPMNPVAEIPFAPSPWPVVEDFHSILRAAGIICTVRRQMGRDIKAACGQLYADLKRTSNSA